MPEANADSLKQAAHDIKQAFGETEARLREMLTKQGEEIAKHGETSTKTVEQIKAIEAEIKVHGEKQADLFKQVEELHKRTSRRGSIVDADGNSVGEHKSLGQLFIESDEYRDMVKQKRAVSDRYEFKGRWADIARKDLLALGASGTSLGIADPYRVPNLVTAAMRRMRIRDLMNVVTLTDTDSVQYVRETGFSSLATTAASGASAAATSLTVANAVGFYAGQTIRIEGDGGEFTEVISAVNRDTGVLTVSALDDDVSAGAYVRADTMAGTPPTYEKPDLDLNIGLKTQAVVTIAGTVTVPRQSLADINRLRNFIDNKMVYALQLSEEAHILYGDGSEEMMPGILNDADRQTFAWSDGVVGDTRIDAVRRGVTKVMLADYEPNGVVMHPNDWQEVEMAKGTDDHYIWVNVNSGGVSRLWAMPVVPTRAIAEGTSVVGAWGLGGVLYDREQASIRVFEQHADYAKKNLALLLGEERATVTWERPESFCEVSFDAAPT